MRLFDKASGVARYFQKGQGNILLRKGGETLSTVAPLLSLVNPTWGITATTIGRAGTTLADSIKA